MLLRLDNVLVQQPARGNTRVFAFRGRRWSVYSSVIALIVLSGTMLIQDMDGVRYQAYLVPGGYVFAGLFAYSAIYSFFTTRVLEIDGGQRRVRYRKSNFYGSNQWQKNFTDFADVRIWRPGRKSFLIVVLRLRDQQEIPLGSGEAGILSLDKAQALAGDVAALMNLPIVEEPTVHWKLR